MIYEIHQVKTWLAKNLNLRTEGSGQWDLRIVDPVPEGDYVIPIGRTETLFHVRVEDDRIHIGKPVSEMENTMVPFQELEDGAKLILPEDLEKMKSGRIPAVSVCVKTGPGMVTSMLSSLDVSVTADHLVVRVITS